MIRGVPSVASARAGLVLAAVLWSLGSLFMRLFENPTPMNLHDPHLTPLQRAFFRAMFAGLVMVPLLRRADLRWNPLLPGMVLTFATMSGLYLSALGLGSAGNAIFLQNTAPFWVFVIGTVLLRDSAPRRDAEAALIGLTGAIVIVAGGWGAEPPRPGAPPAALVLGMGVASGLTYAGVILFLRRLREFSPTWLVFLNHLGSSAVIGLFVLVTAGPSDWWAWLTTPTPRQLAGLAVFGAVQMAVPYWLFARGLRSVGPAEAGIITLLEPVLNPVWAYLISPETDRPTVPLLAGGGLILLALFWRYAPRRKR